MTAFTTASSTAWSLIFAPSRNLHIAMVASYTYWLMRAAARAAGRTAGPLTTRAPMPLCQRQHRGRLA